MSHRIVSLIPSGTEIVAALGLLDQLVGRSHECDFPTAVKSLPVCSQPRLDLSGGSREIDNQVRAAVKDALSIYRVLTEELHRLEPTLLITQSQCAVCAVSLDEVRSAVCNAVGSNPEILSHEPMQLADLWRDIQKTAETLGVSHRGADLVFELTSRLQRIQDNLDFNAPPVRALCLEWLDPLMSAGNWVPELVEIAGGFPLLCTAGAHSPYFTWEEMLAADPDLILIMPCGFDLARTIEECSILQNNPLWKSLRAVQNGDIYATDGNQYFNRPGPRLVESAEILAEVFQHSGSVTSIPTYQHHGTGWVQLTERQIPPGV